MSKDEFCKDLEDLIKDFSKADRKIIERNIFGDDYLCQDPYEQPDKNFKKLVDKWSPKE